jgi:hypothetical protein
LEIFNFFRPSAAAGKFQFFSLCRRRRRLENLKIFSVISGGGWIFFERISGGGGGSAARLTPLVVLWIF